MIFFVKTISRTLKTITIPLRLFSTTSQCNFKVAVLGSSGGIGQPLSLLLKQNKLVTHLALYDVAKINPGVGVDLSHMNTTTYVESFTGPDQLFCALYGTHVVVIPAGIPRKPGMTRDDLFNTNAGIVFDLTCGIARYCPCALVAIITNPVNSTVPIASEVMMKCGVYDPTKIFGVTTLDCVRASTFVSQINCCDPVTQLVPVIGGHAGETIIPLLSQCNPPVFLTDQVRVALTKRIQDAGTEVVKAKAGGGSATLSMAFAAARFTDALMRGLLGYRSVVECAYVRSTVTKCTYFANPVLLGRCGLEKNLGYGCVTPFERGLIDKAIPMLVKNIDTGLKFVEKKTSKK